MTNQRTFLTVGLSLAIAMITCIQVNAQSIELTPIIGYETGANINTSGGDLHISDGMVYGGVLNVGLGGGRFAELSYTHMVSDLSLEGLVFTLK